MGNDPQAPLLRVTYTDMALVTMADAIVTNFQQAGIAAEGPAIETPTRGVLGAPEILITIIATAAAKAAIKTSIHVLRQYLESRTAANGQSRLQVIVDQPGRTKRRFPINLRNLTADAIEEFLSDVVDAVGGI